MPPNTYLRHDEVLQVSSRGLGDPEISPGLRPRAETTVLSQELPQHRELTGPERPFRLRTAVRDGVLVLPDKQTTTKLVTSLTSVYVTQEHCNTFPAICKIMTCLVTFV